MTATRRSSCFVSTSIALFLCFNLKAAVAIGVEFSTSRWPFDPSADQSVDGHQRDGQHRDRREEDDDGKDPVWIWLCLRFGEQMLKGKKKMYKTIMNR